LPIYDYICHSCSHRFEVVHGVHAHGPSTCPVCHEGPVRKAFVAPTIHFKGSGWAKKDRGSSAGSSGSSKSGSDGGDSSSSETGSTPPASTPPASTPAAPAGGVTAAGGSE
jgi:putative FmdB family regulatory protein